MKTSAALNNIFTYCDRATIGVLKVSFIIMSKDTSIIKFVPFSTSADVA